MSLAGSIPVAATARRALALLALAGSAVVLATAGSAAQATFPGPNGKIAVAALNPGVEPGVDLVNPDGSGRTRIRLPGGTGPVWSADGKWLAYSTWPEPWVIRVARADGSADREVLPKTAGAAATHFTYAWSPNGTEIAYQCATGLCAVRVSDGTTRRILDKFSFFEIGSYPSWAPDGKKIAFHCTALCIVNADGSDAVVFTTQPGTALGRFPDWSPDGTRLLLTNRGQVQALDVDDGELRLLADLGGTLNVRAHWSPDGKSVLISQSGNGVYLLRLDGSQPVKIPGGVFGDWGTSPAVMVSEARFEPHWVLSRQAGSLVVSGTASHASTLSVTLRSGKRTFDPIPASVPAGEFAVPVRLPADALPGAHTVSISGTSGTERLLTVVRDASLAAPATGLVSRSWISLKPRGVPTARVPRTTKRLFAQFVFSHRPAPGQRLSAVWVAPPGVVRLREPVSAVAIARSSISSEAPLARGRWSCRLEAGKTVLAIASVRVG